MEMYFSIELLTFSPIIEYADPIVFILVQRLWWSVSFPLNIDIQYLRLYSDRLLV